MAGLNKIFLIGNLTRDPELRYTPSGLAVTGFTVASNRSYTTQSGEKKDTATFLRVVVWGKRAETCGEYLNKGSLVFVEGRVQNKSWQSQDGTKNNSVEIVANNVQFLGMPKRPGAQTQNRPRATETQEPMDITPEVDIPPVHGQEKQNNIEDEIPF